jgi:peptide/nickel transport system substrate-binding protein
MVFVSVSSAAPRSLRGTIPLLRFGELTPGVATLDPNVNQGCGGECGLYLEHLLTVNQNGKLVPQLATSISEPGKAVYVFHLRHGVKFWDGNEMTSADVANAINYQRYPASQTALYFQSVKSVVATDRYTVAVTLKHVDATFLGNLWFEGGIWEKKFQDAHKTTFGNPGVLMMATGPWKLDSYNATTSMEVTANPHWWGGKVNIKHISVRFFSDDQSGALAMRAGEIDVYFPADARAFAATSGASILSAPTNNVGFFGMNVTQPPWNDLHVRRAVAYALNRADIVSAVGGYAAQQGTLIPGFVLRSLGTAAQVNAVEKTVPRYSFNLAKAKSELAKSAYPNGFTASTDTFDYGPYVPVNEVIAGDLQKIGITLKINVVDPGRWLDEIYGAHTFPDMFSTIASQNPDPGLVPVYILGSAAAKAGGLNWANWAPAGFDQLLKQSVTTLNHTRRLAIYGQMMKRVATDVPYVPLFLSENLVAISKNYTWPSFSTFPYWHSFHAFALGLKTK